MKNSGRLFLLIALLAGRTAVAQPSREICYGDPDWQITVFSMGHLFGQTIFNTYAYASDHGQSDGPRTRVVKLFRCSLEKNKNCFTVEKGIPPIDLPYFSGREDSLYDLLEQGKGLHYAFIDTLDLNRLLADSDRIADKRVIRFRYSLQFANCIIHHIRWPDEMVDAEGMDNKEDSTWPALFRKPVSFTNTYLAEDLALKASFEDTFFIYNFLVRHLYLGKSNFHKACILAFRLPMPAAKRPAIFTAMGADTLEKLLSVSIRERSIFSGDLYIRNTMRDARVSLNNDYMDGRTFLGSFISEWNGHPLINKSASLLGKITDMDVDDQFYQYYDTRIGYNMDCSGSVFKKKLSLRNSSVFNLDVQNCKFFDTVDIYNTLRFGLDGTDTGAAKGFSTAYFLNKNNILVNIDNFKIDSLRLNNSSIRQTGIVYPLRTNTKDFVLTEDSLQRIEDFYDGCIAWAENKYQKEKELSDELTAKYNHLKLHYQVEYYRTNPSFGNFFLYLWYSFLELVVANGYHGEARFFRTTALVICLFAGIYFVFFKRDILQFIDPEKAPANADPKEKIPGMGFLTFVKCIWASMVIFLTPKFTKSYFGYRPAFFWVLAIEWFTGLILLALFFVYIATTYPFIRSLIGL
jgi:hypothetical protein